jgi:hypothetical protein
LLFISLKDKKCPLIKKNIYSFWMFFSVILRFKNVRNFFVEKVSLNRTLDRSTPLLQAMVASFSACYKGHRRNLTRRTGRPDSANLPHYGDPFSAVFL